MLLWKCTLEVADHVDLNLTKYDYTKSLVDAGLLYANSTNTTFQKEPRYTPGPHLMLFLGLGKIRIKWISH